MSPRSTLLALVALCALAPSLHAQQFRVVDLGTLAGHEESRAWGLNDHGQVVGWSRSGSTLRAFRHDPGAGMVDLGVLAGASSSAARGIANDGSVVGSSWAAPISQPGHAVLWTPTGLPVDLGALPGGATSEAFAVNSQGRVVGQAQGAAFSPEPFIASAATGANLASLAPGAAGNAWAVDEAGWIAGEVVLAPVLWSPAGVREDLATLPGLPRGRAQAINGQRAVAGVLEDPSGTTARLVLWDDAGLHDLGVVGRYSQVSDLNDGGWIVGSDQFSFQVAARGFVHRPGVGLQYVDDLLDASSSGWTITSVFGVNEAGQFAANGVDPSGARRAVRLDPTGAFAGLAVTTSCRGELNSAGLEGRLTPSAIDVVGRTMDLGVSGLPAGTFGMSLVSRSPGYTARPGGSAGALCLGGVIGRRVGGQVMVASAAGAWLEPCDLDAIPLAATYAAVQQGETWHFQAWYRDVAAGGGPTSNFTSASRVRF